jgi:hypothetical protein
MDVLFWMSHSACSVWPVPFWMSRPNCSCPVVPVLFCLSRSSCPVLTVLFCLSHSKCPIRLSCSSCPGCTLLGVLPRLLYTGSTVRSAPWPGSPVLALLSWRSCSGSSPVLLNVKRNRERERKPAGQKETRSMKLRAFKSRGAGVARVWMQKR